MPLFGITLRSVRYSDSTPVFEQSLDEDLIGKARPIKKWDLISDYQFSLDYWFTSSAPSPDFDAGLLCGVLDIKDENNESIWINWNQDHPDLAKELWPIAADMARRGLYIELSEIMLKGVGLEKDDSDQFMAFVEESGSNALNELADENFNQSNFQEAADIFSRSIEIQPSKRAFLGRAKSYRNLGDKTKSETDELAAQKFDN